MFNIQIKTNSVMLLAGILAGSFPFSPVQAQSPTPATTSAAVHAQSNRFPKRAGLHYGLVWGVDSLAVKWAESGELVRFSWHVVDAKKAQALNDKSLEPQLIDPQAGVSLVIPQLAKVGKLRQSNTAVTGKSYWMAFSNKGRRVKRGDHVSVVIGKFRADGLVVD
jgi:hypothetical protein